MEKAARQLPIPPFKKIKGKAAKWVKRFLPAEIIGTSAAVVCAYAARHFVYDRVTIAYITSIAETTGFYLTIIATDVLLVRKNLKGENRTLTLKQLLFILKNIALDFGPAELADSLVVRPLFMYLFPMWIGNYGVAVILGKLASDLTFYVPVIISAEVRLYFVKKNRL